MKPWEKDWSQPIQNENTGQKPWERDWSKSTAKEQPAPQEDAFHGAAKTVLKGLGYAAEAIDRLGPAQIRNIVSAAIDQAQFKKTDKNLSDFVTGSNAPSASDILNKAGVPAASIKLPPFGAENLNDLQTTPKLSEAERVHQTLTDTGLTTNDVLGLIADYKLQAVSNKVLKVGAEITRKILSKSGDILKNVTIKGGETLTGIPRQNIKTYIEKNPEVRDLIAKYGGDMTQAADDLRIRLSDALKSKVLSLNDEIKTAISNAPEGSKESNKAIIDALEHVQNGVNKDLYPSVHSEIQGMIDKVKKVSSTTSTMYEPAKATSEIAAKQVNEVKRFLQDIASGSYMENGQVFNASSATQNAAKQGARMARKAEISLAPETVQPNLELSQVHNLEKNINKNLITPEKPDVALFSAGSGQNPRNVKNLNKIGQITGMDALGEAEKLSAAKQFSNPSFLPTDTTGKSTTRTLLATGLGAIFGGKIGAVLAPVLTSPAALKTAIDSGQFSKSLFVKLSGGMKEVTPESFKKVMSAIKTPEGQTLVKGAVVVSNAISNEFPKVVRKNGYKTIVKDKKELDEATKEGWR